MIHNLQFIESSHQYLLDGEPIPSVTQLIHSYQHPFEPDDHAERIAARDNTTAAAVKQAWSDKGAAASTQGTSVHAVAESLIHQASAGSISIDPSWGSHARALAHFVIDHPELIGSSDLFPEQRLCHPGYRVAGTCDLIAPLDGVCTVVDWKAVQSIDVLGFGSKVMYSPVNHVTDSNFWAYALQLNVYRVILLDYYDQYPEQMVLVHLRPDGKYERYVMPNMETDARAIMAKGPRKARK